MINKKVSVLMCVYREPLDIIKKSVQSILNQDYKNLEIIFVLDDPSNFEVKLYMSNIANSNKNVKLLINNRNIGLVKSLNIGIESCEGYYIARMDADDISYENRISEQVRYLEENNYDLIGCWYKKINFDDKVIEKKILPFTYIDCIEELKLTNCIPHPGWLLKKETYLKLEGYREIKACEDLDFLIRAVLNGYKIANYPGFLLNYRVNTNGISQTNQPFQILVADFLRQSYKKRNIPSIDDYNLFINSEEFKIKIDKLDNINRLKILIKNKNQKNIIRAISFIKLISNVQFIKYKYKYHLSKLRCRK